MQLTPDESHTIFIGWVRNCLNRSSDFGNYAAGDCVKFLIGRWPEIEPRTQGIILRDIKKELERPGGGGMERNRESWHQVLRQCKLQ
jgi:hypothetical protein